MAEPIATQSLPKSRTLGGSALKLVPRLGRPAIATAVTVVLIGTATAPAATPATANPSRVVPMACGIFWTMVGGTIVFKRDPGCLNDSPPSPAPPGGPPPGDQALPPPGPPPGN